MPHPPTPPESAPKYIRDGLPKQDTDTLHELRGYIDALIDYRTQPVDPEELPDDADPVDTDGDTDAGGTIVEERVKCGADCTCNNGTGHGPYRYRYYYDESGSLTSEYIGKPGDQ